MPGHPGNQTGFPENGENQLLEPPPKSENGLMMWTGS